MIEENEGASKSGLGVKPLIVVAIVIIAAVGGILVMNKLMEPDINPNEISATLVIDYGNGTVEWFNVTTVNNSVPGLLDEAIGPNNVDKERSIEGVLYFDGIRNVKNNGSVGGLSDSEDRWWRYSINGTQAPLTANTFQSRNELAPVRDGQTLDFAFMVSEGPSGAVEMTGISVTVKLNYGNETVISETIITDNYTALGALEEMVGYENLDITDYDWGVLINGINNVSTGSTVEGIDDTSNYYWFWYVNDDFAYVGASQYVLQDGDVMEWSFEESTW
ncbi:MAG: DUF4430 domain-containing protein [Thermoplasmata archaeon]|nr:DUF4430 domain-containing protein [Thermoplasmata archaeon]MCK5397744.1 DUF4430 domain-containing protein [Thermoplasmata archaeon]